MTTEQPAPRCACISGVMCEPCRALKAAVLRHLAAGGAAVDARWRHGAGSPEHLAARAAADVTREELRRVPVPAGRFG